MLSRKCLKLVKSFVFIFVVVTFGYFLTTFYNHHRTRLKKASASKYVGPFSGEMGQSDLVPPFDIPIINQTKSRRLNSNVHIFYYAWYGAPAEDGEWFHWNHKYIDNWDKSDTKTYPTGLHKPPDDVGANFFPSLGAYSSRNISVINEHFSWLESANIGVVAVSWYPPGLRDENGPQSDKMIPTLLEVAQKYNLKICLHIEPYQGRNPENFRRYLQYVHSTYGSHAAYYRVQRGSRSLPVFYVYDSYQVSVQDWSRLFSRKGDLSVRDTELDAIFIALLVEMKHRYDIKKASFDGFYTYFASNGFTYGSSWKHWKGLADYAAKNSLLFIPSVGPGYVDTRVRPWNYKNTRERRKGLYYETAWRTALSTSARYISITSFNEWHEGTQIEPAIPHGYKGYTYESYYPADPDFYLKITKNFTLHPSINN